MAETVEELIVRIEADIRNLRSNLRNATGEVDKSTRRMERSFKRVDGALKRTSNQIFNLRNALVVTLAGAAFRKVIRTFSEYDAGLTRVGKTTNLAGAELEQLGEQLQDLSTQPGTGATIQGLLEIAEAAGQLGVSGSENILLFTRVMAQLAGASDVAGDSGARMIARFLKLQNLPIAAADNMTSALVDLGNNVAATEQEILNVASEVAKAGVQFGISAQDVLGLSAGFKEVDVEAEIAGSGVLRTMQAIQDGVFGGGKALNALNQVLGMTQDELRQMLANDPTELFLRFLEALKKLNAEGRRSFLQDLGLNDVRVTKFLNAVANTVDNVRDRIELSNKAWEDNTARAAEAIRQSKTFSAQMTILANVVDQAAIVIGREFAPVLLALASDLRDALMAAKESGELKKFAEDAAAVIKVLANNLDLLAGAVATLFAMRIATSVGQFVLMFGAWGGAVAAVTAALVLLYAGLTGQVPIYGQLETAIDKAREAVEALKKAEGEQVAQAAKNAQDRIKDIEDIIAALEQQAIAENAAGGYDLTGEDPPAVKAIRKAREEVAALKREVAAATAQQFGPFLPKPPPAKPTPPAGTGEAGTTGYSSAGDTAKDIAEAKAELLRAVDAQNMMNAAMAIGPTRARELAAELEAVNDLISAGALPATVSLDDALAAVRATTGGIATEFGDLEQKLANAKLQAEQIDFEKSLKGSTEELETQLKYLAQGAEEVRVQLRLLELKQKYSEEYAQSQEASIRYEEALKTELEKAKTAMEELNKESTLLEDSIRDLGLTFSSAFEDAVVNGEKLSDVIQALEKDLLRLGLRKLFTEPLFEGITAGAKGKPTTEGGLSQVVSEGISGLKGWIFGEGGAPSKTPPVPRAKPTPPGIVAPESGGFSITKILESLTGADLGSGGGISEFPDAEKNMGELAKKSAEAAGSLGTAATAAGDAGKTMGGDLVEGAIESVVASTTEDAATNMVVASLNALQAAAWAAAASLQAMAASSAASSGSSLAGAASAFAGPALGGTSAAVGGAPAQGLPPGGGVGPAGGGVYLQEGGPVKGPGGSRSDSILARLSNGEYVLNARAAKRNRGLLDMLNANKFADGGIVGNAGGLRAMMASMSQDRGPLTVNINNPRDGASVRRSMSQIRGMAAEFQERMKARDS